MQPYRWGAFLVGIRGIALSVVLWGSDDLHAKSCDDAERVVESGREFLEYGMSYADAKNAARRSAVLAAIQSVNASGYTAVVAGRYSSTSDSSGSSSEAQTVDRTDYQRIRGLVRSEKVLDENIKKLNQLSILEVTVEVFVCPEDPANAETVIVVEDVFWIDGTKSHTLRKDLINNFPTSKRFVVIEDRPGETYSDVVITGKVENISFKSFTRSTKKKSSWFGRKNTRRESSVGYGEPLPEGEKEVLEIVARVKINARVLASHRPFEFKKTMVTEMSVTDDPNWNANRQYEARKMVQVGFKLANKDLLVKLREVR